MNWLMIQVGLLYRWRLTKDDMTWTIMLGSSAAKTMLDETVAQVARMLDEGWVLRKQPKGRDIYQYTLDVTTREAI